ARTRASESGPSSELLSDDILEAEASPESTGRSPDAKLHRFRLTAADVKDTQGAPDIALDGDGRIHLVWASITSETEQSTFHASSAAVFEEFSTSQAVVQ